VNGGVLSQISNRLVRRLGEAALLIVLGGLASAALVRFAPGYGVDVREFDPRLSEDSLASLRSENSLPQGVVSFYAGHLAGVLRGDLGSSDSFGQPIRELIAERLPATAGLLAAGLAGAWALGLGAALLGTWKSSKALDLMTTFASSAFLCLPSALLALLFFLWGDSGVLALVFVLFPQVFRYSRNLLEEARNSPHVLAARARGVSEIRVLFAHVVLPVAGPLLALLGISVNIAFGASIPIEVICGRPGIGQLAWEAALSRDLPLLVNVTMTVTLLTVAANALSDFAQTATEARAS
jgi:peptide/nickel transport system permease protein